MQIIFLVSAFIISITYMHDSGWVGKKELHLTLTWNEGHAKYGTEEKKPKAGKTYA